MREGRASGLSVRWAKGSERIVLRHKKPKGASARKITKLDEALLLASRDPEASEIAFQEAVETNDEVGSASYYFGKQQYEMARYDRAIDLLRRSETRSGFHAATSLLISKCLFKLGRIEESTYRLVGILERYPKHGGAIKLYLTALLVQDNAIGYDAFVEKNKLKPPADLQMKRRLLD